MNALLNAGVKDGKEQRNKVVLNQVNGLVRYTIGAKSLTSLRTSNS